MSRALLLLLLLTAAGLGSCTYQTEEELFAPACEPAMVTYAGHVQPLLQQHCYNQNGVSCHSGPAPEAGIDLSDYATVKVYAGLPSLLGVVSHAPGYPAMPKNAPKLADCDVARLRAWVQAGAPNN
ncbi:hypothetical protein [Hymenobacter sp. B81]|uniref:hypothetical protein n=1 Tax=Hymenobacter sp. B81 TaxID=3344878 RepID=UPI0037DC4029